MSSFFTSDTHASHERACFEFRAGRFASLEAMNQEMADNINKRVNAGDTLYHLGDFSFKGVKEAEAFRSMLNVGNLILILGNHDRHKVHKVEFTRLFSKVLDYAEITIAKRKWVLCHYAFRVWNCAQYGAYHLYGHSHGGIESDRRPNSRDVGVDCHDFSPWSIEEIEQSFIGDTYTAIDHHRGVEI